MKFEYHKCLLGSYFYYSKPLKNTAYLKNLSHEKTLISKSLEGEEYVSALECASEFLINTIYTNYKSNNTDAIRIVDMYENAANDGIIEAANNLGIIYHYLNRSDLCERYFRMASQGGSYLGTFNLEISKEAPQQPIILTNTPVDDLDAIFGPSKEGDDVPF